MLFCKECRFFFFFLVNKMSPGVVARGLHIYHRKTFTHFSKSTTLFLFDRLIIFYFITFIIIFIFIFILQWFLSYIDMNQPWSYMYSPSHSPLPPPSPPTSSGSSQCTRPEQVKQITSPLLFKIYISKIKLSFIILQKPSSVF